MQGVERTMAGVHWGQKGKLRIFTLKYVLSEVKKPGALQPFHVSNSQDTYIKVDGST